MKLNWKVRLKNPCFWVGLIGAVLASLGISASDVTSWSAITDVFASFIHNPVAVISTVLTVAGIVVDPTTAGVSDSDRAMTYNSPNQSDSEEQ